ncbi:hypothetical protein AB0I35_11875 [Nocardia sp. NPDC050378]
MKIAIVAGHARILDATQRNSPFPDFARVADVIEVTVTGGTGM